MIRHIVFFSAKPGIEAETIRDGLMKLADIPSSSHFEVALNSKVDPWSSEVDIVVYAEFADEAALAAFKTHPVYAQTTNRVRPMRELRLSADFTADI
ncbi:MAG: Dabb family protein [Rhizobiaceae bacterium]|nr:Dabb family protein [Rhizobiaceae bacterium]